MLKIKDNSGKTVMVLKDEDNAPEPVEKECDCDCGDKCPGKKDNKCCKEGE